ncbi:uncharacterized protein LOC142226879 [Haematobia irritans]|uniref:uncharacterized protein LOC142226879 n=1 Tax=Haematobia irritans TaxID=7368 RepID=UPI003F4F5BBE
MASNESAESFEELNIESDTSTTTMPSESSQHLSAIEEEESSSSMSGTTRRRSAAYRGVRFATTEVVGNDEDESWWWEVENDNLTLDQVPNVTSVFTPSPEDILEQPARVDEAQISAYEEEFERLHRIAKRIKNTMNEQRERHLSESSEKSLPDSLKLEGQESSRRDSTSSVSKDQSLEEFKEELRIKRATRQTAIQSMRDEMAELRKQLEREREISRRLRRGEKVEETELDFVEPKATVSKTLANTDDEDLQGATALVRKVSAKVDLANAADDDDDENPLSRSRHANIELANAQLALQMANSENLSLRGELDIVQKQVISLKDVISCCKQMLTLKEEQCNELKQRLSEIEESFAEHEMKIMSDNLRQEYERQLVNIRQLRQLYEERQRVAAAEYENLQRLISIKRDELGQEQEKTKNLEERNQNMVREIELANNELACLRDECKEHRFEKAALKEEMGAVNTLFSQMVMGFNGKNNLDIDRLTTMLEENRTLLNDMATKECTDGATLPKLLFELVEQASVVDNEKASSPSPAFSSLGLKDADSMPVTQKNNSNIVGNANEDGPMDEDGMGSGDSDGDGSNTNSQQEDDVEVEEQQHGDESMMALGANNDNDAPVPVPEPSPSATLTNALDHGNQRLQQFDVHEQGQQHQQQEQQQPNQDHTEQVDNVDAVVASMVSSPMGAIPAEVPMATINEKVSVAQDQPKSKKQHHHSHHRKGSNSGNKKATASCSSSSSLAIGGASSSSSSASTNANATNATATATASTSTTSSRRTMKFNDASIMGKVTSTQEIIGNLPKVWRVLMELLNHHHTDPVPFEENGKGEDCYKSVETPHGPKAELSVSKTYLKLKDLILEKKSLVKETNRLKTLNCHLDYRLNEQEKRLSAVSLELTKTWHLVGKMQRQHRQLHTQEQILRYQLQQKRRLLHELKDELEYCRRKWQAARAKNDESQEQCNDLRREFARRKLEDANNSAESGYSDSGGPVSDEEPMMGIGPLDEAEGAVGVSPKGGLDAEDDCEEEMNVTSTSAGACVNYRRKRLREMFENTRKIKRMQSTSPGRANGNNAMDNMDEVVLRWNSAPPTCGWRDIGAGAAGGGEAYGGDPSLLRGGILENMGSSSSHPRGAIPKTRSSRKPQRRGVERSNATELDEEEPVVVAEAAEDRAVRIQRLEEQCKSLIKQVLETSDNRERLEIQLKRFQDEMSPVQYAVPLDELLNKKRVDRMTRASSAPAPGTLTPREEEYTRRRSERLGRLEEESRQLLFRIKRTSDRGHYLRCSLDRIRRAPPSREGSFESNTEDEARKSEEELPSNLNENTSMGDDVATASSSKKSPLTAEEEAYTARRSARLQRLEAESKQLLSKLSHNNQRGDSLGSRLDTLHERHGSLEAPRPTTSTRISTTSNTPASGQLTTEQRIENIEKISSNREQRLRILEEEGRQLINRLSETSEKGTQMINRIAERELSRQNRSSSTPQRETDSTGDAKEPSASGVDPLLPPLKNVACSSIVGDELTERVTITTTPSQIAAHQGAIPKVKSLTAGQTTKPATQLLSTRSKSARLQSVSASKNCDQKEESLEDMVRRLQALPFPSNKPDEGEGDTSNKTSPTTQVNEMPAANENKCLTIQEISTTMEESMVADETSTPAPPTEVDDVTSGNI